MLPSSSHQIWQFCASLVTNSRGKNETAQLPVQIEKAHATSTFSKTHYLWVLSDHLRNVRWLRPSEEIQATVRDHRLWPLPKVRSQLKARISQHTHEWRHLKDSISKLWSNPRCLVVPAENPDILEQKQAIASTPCPNSSPTDSISTKNGLF